MVPQTTTSNLGLWEVLRESSQTLSLSPKGLELTTTDHSLVQDLDPKGQSWVFLILPNTGITHIKH